MNSTAAYNLQVHRLFHLEMLRYLLFLFRDTPSLSLFSLFSVTSEYYATANASQSFSIKMPNRGLFDHIVSRTVLVIWNHLCTVDTEIEFFWSRKITAPSALFLTIRYLTLSWAIYGTPWFYGISTSQVRNSSLLTGLGLRSFRVPLQG